MPVEEPALVELSAVEVLHELGSYTAAVADPPWSALAAQVPAPVRTIMAGDMSLAALDAIAAADDRSDVVVGIGGGAALDTAKFVAWKRSRRLLLIPSITSVDAAFTDAVGVRVSGRVRYVGRVRPERVVLDLGLIGSAPARLNRAGIGDVLSCHTALWDWRLSVEAGHDRCDDDLAALGRSLLRELDDAADDVRAVSPDGVRFLARAYQRIGAACSAAGHSRFEEGSEHFCAYSYEHLGGPPQVHGELVAMWVAAMSFLQGNDPSWVLDVVGRCGATANPVDLGVTEDVFTRSLLRARDYVQEEALDHSVLDETRLDAQAAADVWRHVTTLARTP